MVEVKQTIEMYKSHGDVFSSQDMEELNDKLSDLGINCSVRQTTDDDGMKLIFTKEDR